jgi:hypothetical protein
MSFQNKPPYLLLCHRIRRIENWTNVLRITFCEVQVVILLKSIGNGLHRFNIAELLELAADLIIVDMPCL